MGLDFTLPKRTGTAPAAERPKCATCQGAQYLRYDVPVDDPKFGKMVPCPDCKTPELAHSKIARLVGSSGLDKSRKHTAKARAKYFVHYVPRPEQRPAFTAAKNFAQAPEGWLVLIGAHGEGKTTIAQCIGNHCLDQGRSVIYRNAPELLETLRSAFEPNADMPFQQVWQLLSDVEILIIDELGREHQTGWVNEKLFMLIEHRWRDRIPTVICSNKPPQSLDGAIASRLQDSSLVQQFNLRPA